MMNMRSRFLLLLVSVVLLLAVVEAASGSETSKYLVQEVLAPIQLAVVREGNIWLITMDNLTPDEQLTNSGLDCCIQWSPDGLTLYYVREVERLTNYEIYAYSFINETEQLLDLSGENIQPPFAISPDGQTLTYVSERTIEAQPNEALLLGYESCLMTINLTTVSTQEIYCFRDLGIGAMDYSPDGHQLALSIFGFEYAEVGIFNLESFTYQKVGCCGKPLFRTNNELIISGSPSFFNPDPGIFSLTIAPPTFTKLVGSANRLQISDIVDDGQGMLYTENDFIMYYLFEFDHSIVMLVSGQQPKQRPPVTKPTVSLPPEFETWLGGKQDLINRLDTPPFTVLNTTFTVPEELVLGWGYDEDQPQNLLNTIQVDLERFNNGSMTAEEMDLFASKAEVFGRFYLSEQAMDNFYPLYAQTTYNTAESMVGVISMVIGTVQSVRQAAERLISDGNPFSHVIVKLSREIERQMFELADNFLRLVLAATPDPELRTDLNFMWEQIYRAVQLRYDAELDTGQTLMDLFLDEGVKSAFAAWFLHDYFQQTQPLINDGVSKVNMSGDTPVITGSFEDASGHMDNFYFDAETYTGIMAQQHNDFQQAINVTELAASFSFLAARADGTRISTIIGVISSLMGIGLNVYDGSCQAEHLTFLRQSVEQSHVYAFDAERPLSWDTPSHCDFSYWSDLSNQPTSNSTSTSQMVPLAELQVGETIADFRDKLNELRLMVSQGEASEVAVGLDSMFIAENSLSTELNILVAPLSSGFPTEGVRLLQRDMIEFNLQTAVLYATFISYFAAPENQDLQTQVQNQIDQVNQTLANLSIASIPKVSPTHMEIFTGPPLLIARLEIPAWTKENEPAVITATIANVSSDTATVVLSIRDSENTLATVEDITVDAGGREVIALHIPGFELGEHLLFSQLMGPNDELLDNKPFLIDTLSPTQTILLEASEGVNITGIEDVGAELSEQGGGNEPSTTTGPTQAEGLEFILLGLGAFLLVLVVGSSIYLYWRWQKCN